MAPFLPLHLLADRSKPKETARGVDPPTLPGFAQLPFLLRKNTVNLPKPVSENLGSVTQPGDGLAIAGHAPARASGQRVANWTIFELELTQFAATETLLVYYCISIQGINFILRLRWYQYVISTLKHYFNRVPLCGTSVLLCGTSLFEALF